MQTIKEKLSDMSAMRKAKAEAKEEEKAEKEFAKARVEVAREVRMAREAEAQMDLHVNKAAQKVANYEPKNCEKAQPDMISWDENPPHNSTNYTRDTGPDASYPSDPAAHGGVAGHNRTGGPPTHNNLL